MSGDFTILIDYEGDGRVRVACDGTLDYPDCDRLKDACEVAIAQRPERLVLDATGVTMLTSAGVRLFVHLTERCKEKEVRLELAFSPEVRRVLDLVGLWWLGAIDGKIATPVELRQAIQRFADRRVADRWRPKNRRLDISSA